MIGSTESRPAPFLTRFTGEVHERSTVYCVLRRAGDNRSAERSNGVYLCLGSLELRKQQRDAAMTAALGTLFGATVALMIYWLLFDKD